MISNRLKRAILGDTNICLSYFKWRIFNLSLSMSIENLVMIRSPITLIKIISLMQHMFEIFSKVIVTLKYSLNTMFSILNCEQDSFKLRFNLMDKIFETNNPCVEIFTLEQPSLEHIIYRYVVFIPLRNCSRCQVFGNFFRVHAQDIFDSV